MLQTFWRKLTSPRKPVNTRKGVKLGVELLEDRRLLTTVIAEYPVTAGSAPYGMTQGSDGNLWFTQWNASKIAVLNPTTKAVTEYLTPTANAGPSSIVAGPDGNLWFTEANANKIGVINPTTKAITEYTIPVAGSMPTQITVGADGNLWFTMPSSNRIGVINPTTKIMSSFAIPTASGAPAGIVSGSDGNLWFTEKNGNKIGMINPTTKVISEYTISIANSQPYGITSGSDGNIWFTAGGSNRIGRINVSTKAITHFTIPTANSGPLWITSASDGNLWFTASTSHQIGTFNMNTNTITMMNTPTANSAPAGITSGPNGTLWFAEASGNRIAQVVATPTVLTMPASQTVTEGQTATFVASATGFPAPTIQWQVSTNNGVNFTALANGGAYNGVTTGTLTVTGATMAMNNYQYRAVFTNGISPTPSATTAPATLTVNSVLSVNPSQTPQGVIGVNYNQVLSVVGSTSGFTLFSVNSFNAGGTGLTLANITTNPVNGTITINGTPTGAGTATFILAVANSGGNSLTQTISITINPPLSIATAPLPAATAGMAYNQNISIVGGAMPYATFEVTNWDAGTTGLTPAAISTIPPLGIFNINGTPLAAGTVTFTVNVTDAHGTTVTKDYSIVVTPALTLPATLPPATVNTLYNKTLTVTGGGTPYATLDITGFSAGPTGLTLANITTNTATGTIVINGTPTGTGSATFTVNVVDANGATLTKTYTIQVNSALAITPSLPQGTANTAYSQVVTVTGGSLPFTTFSVTGFNGGTTGLTSAAITINQAAGTITLAGTPTAAGTITFTVNVTDTAGATLTKTYTVTINPTLTVGNLTTTQWTAGLAGFTGTLTINGGTVPHSIVGVTNLPNGLSAIVTGNTISFIGIPTVAATFNASITVRDAAGATVTKTFAITINGRPTVGELAGSQWTVGRSGYTGTLALAGGTGGLTVLGSTGLPTGLTIVKNGNVLNFTGTPTVAGTFAGTVTLRDSLGATVTGSFRITINAAPAIGNLTTTQWTAGKSGFTGTLAITGGTTPYAITAQSGLPTGLTAVVSGGTIRFIGTPTTAGTFNGSITMVDAAGASVTKTFSLKINPPVVIATASVPSARLGMPYATTLASTGGTGPITFTLTAGSLPPGYRLNADGTITGLARAFGTYTFSATATDTIGATFVKTFTLTIGRF